MRILLLVLNIFFLFPSLRAQDTEITDAADEACICISKIDVSTERQKKYAEVKECISSTILMQQMNNSLMGMMEKTKDTLEKIEDLSKVDSMTIEDDNYVIVADKNYEEIEEYLLRNCESMKSVMTTDEVISKTSISDKKKAKKLYDEGLIFFKKESYDMAISKFQKAVKKDRQFAFAWDMLGYSYRKQEKYKKAILCYDKSIAADPKGRMPLMNKPIAYALMGDHENAIKGYEHFIEVFPDDPEGYYGIGRIYHLQGDYENALDTTMKAYLMYNAIKSPYARDAEHNLSLFYKELKAKDQLDLFNKMAEKHNIKIN